MASDGRRFWSSGLAGSLRSWADLLALVVMRYSVVGRNSINNMRHVLTRQAA